MGRRRNRHKEVLTYKPHETQSRAALLALKEQYMVDPEVDTALPHEVWLDFRMKLLTRWEDERGSLKCHYCGRDNLCKVTEYVQPKYQATLDHVQPRAKGGAEYDEDNLVVACAPCNWKKGDDYE